MDNDEFGPGSGERTRRVQQRHGVKLLIQINRLCATPDCKRAYALENIENAVADYEKNYDMKIRRDFDVAAVVHSEGGRMVLKDAVLRARKIDGNPFEQQVRALLDRGVRFYLCQNTTRHLIASGVVENGKVMESLIEGVEFVTAGITALADMQARGWTYVQP